MVVKLSNGSDILLALLGIKGTVELELNLFAFLQIEGFRAFEGALIFILLDAVGTLETEVLFARSSADIWLLCDVVTDNALVLLSLFCFLYKGLGL